MKRIPTPRPVNARRAAAGLVFGLGTLAAALGRALEEIERLQFRVRRLENNGRKQWFGDSSTGT